MADEPETPLKGKAKPRPRAKARDYKGECLELQQRVACAIRLLRKCQPTQGTGLGLIEAAIETLEGGAA